MLTVSSCIPTVQFGTHQSYDWLDISLCLLVLSTIWQIRLYQLHAKQALFVINTLENSDNTSHSPEENGTPESQKISRAPSQVGHILHSVKAGTAQQEKYYELILDSANIGLPILNDGRTVYRENEETLRLLGLSIFTHVHQLSKVDTTSMEKIENCRPEGKLQVIFHNERGAVNLSIRVSEINMYKEHPRILALNDIDTELDEKEINPWIRLTRALTYEIVNSVIPTTPLYDTLLSMSEDKDEEISRGLQTISITGKGLLSFVESYRQFTYVPAPGPPLFYVKAFIERIIELARHQSLCDATCFHTEISPTDLVLHADENLITQAVTNLLKNVIQAIDSRPDSRIELQAYCNDMEKIWIEIKNNGPEIPSEIAEHIFIPLFTTKENSDEIGFSISRQIMRPLSGSLTLLWEKETTSILKFK